jgi:PPOX class probable F420-dependent enzyme
MASLTDAPVRALLEAPNFASITTRSPDGLMHGAVVWLSLEDGVLAVNGAEGRAWSTHLETDPAIVLVVPDKDNPYEYVEIRGTASGSRDDADDHINRLAKKYIDQDEYPFRAPGEVRVKFTISPERIRHQKQ